METNAGAAVDGSRSFEPRTAHSPALQLTRKYCSVIDFGAHVCVRFPTLVFVFLRKLLTLRGRDRGFEFSHRKKVSIIYEISLHNAICQKDPITINAPSATLACDEHNALIDLRQIAAYSTPPNDSTVVMKRNRLIWLLVGCGLTVGFVSVAEADIADGIIAYKQGDYDTAFKEFKPIAEQGFAGVQDLLGWMYYNGKGVPQDHTEALYWYRKAAEQDNANAQSKLGLMYHSGEGVPQNYKEAVKWYRKAAEQGDVSTQLMLGLMYDSGEAVLQDGKEAVKWYRMAAQQGNANAQSNLGLMYSKGDGVPRDYILAHMWFTVAATQGNEVAIKGRDIVATRMTSEQIAEAQKLARE